MTTRKLELRIIAAADGNDNDDDDNDNNNNSESLESITFWAVVYTSKCEAHELSRMEYTADHNCLCVWREICRKFRWGQVKWEGSEV
jgi:hypothetical protein